MLLSLKSQLSEFPRQAFATLMAVDQRIQKKSRLVRVQLDRPLVKQNVQVVTSVSEFRARPTK